MSLRYKNSIVRKTGKAMKKQFFVYGIFAIILTIGPGCYYDNEEILYPDITACDTANVTFNRTITKLLSDNCLSCHSNSQAAANGNNIRLESHADVAANAVRVSGAINHLPSYTPMPKNGGKLSSCLIRQFDLWIQKGTPDN